MPATVFTPALDAFLHIKSSQGYLLSKPFLQVCGLVLPVIDKFGSSMALVKSDVGGNISAIPFTIDYLAVYFRFITSLDAEASILSVTKITSVPTVEPDGKRLDAKYETDTISYHMLYDIVRKEIVDKTAQQSSSCTNGLLWLTRAMDFLVELFRNLLVHPDWTMTQAANEAYAVSLKRWHGWIASAAFTVAMKLVPDRKKFYDLLGEGALDEDIEMFVTKFAPVLHENHKFLQSVGMDDVRAS